MNQTISTLTQPATQTRRYSDQELDEFRSIINQRLSEAVLDYEMLRNAVSGEGNGTNDTSPSFRGVTEDITDMLSREEMAGLAVRRQKYIKELRNALIRIQNKTYGICRVTGELIAPERLRSVPHTTLSMNAKTAGL